MTAFEEIYKDNYSRLFTLAFRMTGNKQDSEDVLQNSFINAYRAFRNFRNESSIYTWLYKIVVNEAKRYKNYTEKLPVEEYAEENNISSKKVFEYINSFGEVEDEVLVNNAKETCLQLFMNCMPPIYRVVFTLRIILQLSVKDTAEILQISESAVKVNLHRARNLIKELMEGRCSLINPNKPCKCSSWVKYAMETKRNFIIKDIKVIKNSEKRIANEFKCEVKELYSIASLYDTEVIPESYESFMKKIKNLIREKKLKILNLE